MIDELTFQVRTVLNVLVLTLALARARHLGRRVWARVLGVLALPFLALLWALENVLTALVNLVVLAAWLYILRHQ